MRGKAPDLLHAQMKGGITPAYAGKSRVLCRFGSVLEDHPRVCGEKFKVTQYIICLTGSPPRMRGKEDSVLRRILRVGITPAYAGKRLELVRAGGKDEDHPRVCGEKTKKIP